MRWRSIPFITVALISCFFIWTWADDLQRTLQSYGYRDIDIPIPTYIKLLILLFAGTGLVGLPMLVVDFTRWTKNRKA
jgi:hypothetical protein